MIRLTHCGIWHLLWHRFWHYPFDRKKNCKALGPELADKPLNVNRIDAEHMLQYPVMVPGTPSYGKGSLPEKSSGIEAGSWEEFLPQIEYLDFSDKVVALYGLGDQEKYSQHFADALIQLYDVLKRQGATIIGGWETKGYDFNHSKSVVDDKFVGLIIDNASQGLLTDDRIRRWLELIKSAMVATLENSSAEPVA